MSANNRRISIGTKITAAGGLWTVIGCGNGRYSVRCAGARGKHTIPCEELHADLAAGRAFLANASCYANETAGVAYPHAMRSIHLAMRGAA